MALFKCENPNCKKHDDIKEHTGTLRLHWDDEKAKYVSYFKCEECGEYLLGYRDKSLDLNKVSSINKGATKVSRDHRNTIY